MRSADQLREESSMLYAMIRSVEQALRALPASGPSRARTEQRLAALEADHKAITELMQQTRCDFTTHAKRAGEMAVFVSQDINAVELLRSVSSKAATKSKSDIRQALMSEAEALLEAAAGAIARATILSRALEQDQAA